MVPFVDALEKVASPKENPATLNNAHVTLNSGEIHGIRGTS
jgi:hypothetical protein